MYLLQSHNSHLKDPLPQMWKTVIKPNFVCSVVRPANSGALQIENTMKKCFCTEQTYNFFSSYSKNYAAQQLFTEIYIVLGITSNLEVIESVQEDVLLCKSYAILPRLKHLGYEALST